jgi:ATP-dependent DNA helicase RecG
VEDRSRNVRGVAHPLDEEERLANLIIDRISSRLVPDLEILPWRQTQVLALQLYPSPSRSHHLIGAGHLAGAYVRVGSTNRRADAELIVEQPLQGLSSEAIVFRLACESFAPIRALRRRDLEALRLVADHQGKTVPTTAA